MRAARLSLRPTISLLDFVNRHGASIRSDRLLSDKQRSVALISNSDVIYDNLATEEALLRGVVLRRQEALLLMYVNKPCVVVGRNQNIFSEVALRAAHHDGVSIARRNSGGGAVYHDLGNVSFSVFTHRDTYEPKRSIQLLRWHLCREFGIGPERITTTKRHDLFLDEMKITGSAMRVQRDIACHHFTLLVSSSGSRLGKYLKREGDYISFTTAAVGSVCSRTTTLKEAGVLTDSASADPVNFILRSMAGFFVEHSWDILAHKAPWETNPLNFGDNVDTVESKRTRECRETAAVFTLDTTKAIADGTVMIDGENRRPCAGASKTVREECVRLQSLGWLFNMPKFETRVAITLADILASEETFSKHAALPPSLIAWLLQSCTRVDIITLIENRRVTSITAYWIKQGEPAPEQPWFSCLLRYLVEGRYVDNVFADMGGKCSVLAAAIDLECSQIISGLPAIIPQLSADGSRNGEAVGSVISLAEERERSHDVIQRFLQAVLEVWRRKNVFYPISY
ncbi:lipoate-protein ligase, putative [Trypanosoma equiperdum]|uniref:Lipoate-protein ligase, putative n=1 Tax=Trypanosoma equiperdum TaxID=5694 RepID=A0A1G4HYQ2_TRYEQ|nr:lipoate-protein ligase, putative [Trypanosoma equiperdum]